MNIHIIYFLYRLCNSVNLNAFLEILVQSIT